MRITIETTDNSKEPTTKKVIVETNYDDYTIGDLIEEIIRPLLIAYGYHEKCVEDELADLDITDREFLNK